MASEPDQGITPPTHYYSFLGVSVQRVTEKRCVGARGRERERASDFQTVGYFLPLLLGGGVGVKYCGF
jgi:hypothetical protein